MYVLGMVPFSVSCEGRALVRTEEIRLRTCEDAIIGINGAQGKREAMSALLNNPKTFYERKKSSKACSKNFKRLKRWSIKESS